MNGKGGLFKGLALSRKGKLAFAKFRKAAHQCIRNHQLSLTGEKPNEKCAEPEPLVLLNPTTLVVGSGQCIKTPDNSYVSRNDFPNTISKDKEMEVQREKKSRMYDALER